MAIRSPLSHDLHRFNFGHLECLVLPVDLARVQPINQSITCSNVQYKLQVVQIKRQSEAVEFCFKLVSELYYDVGEEHYSYWQRTVPSCSRL
jgi:hypothetical protein